MSRLILENRIQTILSSDEKLFIPYLMCGDGGFDKTLHLMRLLEASGASVIEIGIPFSDPIADGATIQAAGQRALDNGTTLKKIIEFLKMNQPTHNVPRIMMSYLNPLLQYGLEKFFAELESASISGLIIPDLPLEEYDLIADYARAHNISIIPLIAPSTSLERINQILPKTSGFIYTITVNGITGARSTFSEEVINRLKLLKKETKRPLVAGFGISTKEQVDELSQHCDGVIVGSMIVKAAHKGDYKSIEALMA